MTAAVALYRTSIGKKVVMAVTGCILSAYVVAHMYGNLKVFEGRDTFNAYAAFLRTVGAPLFAYGQLLWMVRVVILAAVVLHIVAAAQLTRQSRASRPVRYAVKKNNGATYASRTMRWGGLIIALFVIYHILDLTTGTLHRDFVPGDVYHNVVTGFQVWYVSTIYIAAMVALGFHLYHGVWSMFHTLGISNRRIDRQLRAGAAVSAIAVVAAGCIVPIAVMIGIVG